MNVKKILDKMHQSPQNIRYSELVAVCQAFFGEPRQQGTSHCVFKTPWQGNPRVNIQGKNGMAKPYQVKKVLSAIAKLNGGE